MMRLGKIQYILIVIFACSLALIFAYQLINRDIYIVDAKTAVTVNEDLMPVKITDSFPRGTSRVYCWIKWRDARINIELVTKWRYLTDDIHIADHALIVPKKDGAGGVELAMPEGKTLPTGSYRIDIMMGRRVLKSIMFKVE